MKLYLDDMRKAPFGWDLARTADECIALLEKGKVEELSLDHDLADEHYGAYRQDPETGEWVQHVPEFRAKTGYDVVLWMVENNVWPSKIILHTMNPAGRQNMQSTIERYAPADVSLEIRIGWKG